MRSKGYEEGLGKDTLRRVGALASPIPFDEASVISRLGEGKSLKFLLKRSKPISRDFAFRAVSQLTREEKQNLISYAVETNNPFDDSTSKNYWVIYFLTTSELEHPSIVTTLQNPISLLNISLQKKCLDVVMYLAVGQVDLEGRELWRIRPQYDTLNIAFRNDDEAMMRFIAGEVPRETMNHQMYNVIMNSNMKGFTVLTTGGIDSRGELWCANGCLGEGTFASRLELAAGTTNPEILFALLHGGTNVFGETWACNVHENNDKVLMKTLGFGRIAVAKRLLTGGVNINGERWAADVSADGNVAIQIAIGSNNIELVRMLLEGGINVFGERWAAVLDDAAVEVSREFGIDPQMSEFIEDMLNRN